MTFEEMARANGWIVTLDSRGDYVAHDDVTGDEDPDYTLDAETEDEAWEELCRLEGITEEGFGHAFRKLPDGSWERIF